MAILDDYNSDLRAFIAREATPVKPDTQFDFDVWESYDQYGWHDMEAKRHIDECGLVVPEGAETREIWFSEFRNTFEDNDDALGVNAYGGDKDSETNIRCNCGKYSGLMMRWEGSLHDALQELLNKR